MVVGAAGVWLGYPIADPIVGLLIAAAILVIVWQSGKLVFTRLLDSVEPDVIEEIPGFGKTTLLAQWRAAEEDDRTFAWVTLDVGDKDPVELPSYKGKGASR